MPVRSLGSSILRWPDSEQVHKALSRWTRGLAQRRQDLLAVAYIGSYARGDWGVGSDIDLLVIVEHNDQPFHKRGLDFDLSELPVPTDLLVYSLQEWRAMTREGSRFFRTASTEGVWLVDRSGLKLSGESAFGSTTNRLGASES